MIKKQLLKHKLIIIVFVVSLISKVSYAQYINFRGPEVAHRTNITSNDSETLPTAYTNAVATSGYSHLDIIYGVGEWTSSWTLTPLFWSTSLSSFIEGNKIIVRNESSGASSESSGVITIPVDQAPYTYIKVGESCGTHPSLNVRLQPVVRNFDRIDNTENTQIIKAIIASGASESNIINLGDFKYITIYIPTGWTTADITFLVSPTYSGYNYEALYDDLEVEVEVQAAAQRAIGLDSHVVNMVANKFIKIRSGSASTPVNQGAERTIYLIVKR